MKYQWGRKDPYTFASSSEAGGKYPVKIYTIDGVLIYQIENGKSNTVKQPVGGVIWSIVAATSMVEVIKNPEIYYGASSNGTIIKPSNYSTDLWNYYWTSYSRGTDGNSINHAFHNDYLKEYISQRFKSIYDPCPFGFRVPSNGTYNVFTLNSRWISRSCVGGHVWNINISTWFAALGRREIALNAVGTQFNTWSSTVFDLAKASWFYFGVDILVYNYEYPTGMGLSVRCIEVSPPLLTDEMKVGM